MCTAIFKMDINKDQFYTTWNSAQCFGIAWIVRVSGRMDKCILYMSPFTVYLKYATLLVSYTTMQNNVKKFVILLLCISVLN